MKKIVLSLFVLIMAISVTVVYAEETTGNIVSLHEDAYSSVNDITWTSHTNNLFDYMTASVDSEGNYVLTQTKTSGTDKSLQLAVTRPVGEVVIAKDDVNRTEVVTNNLNGKYVFEFDIESLVKQYPNTTAPYYAIELYSGTSSVIIVRIRANSLDVLDNSSQASATYKYSVSHSSASSEPADFNLKLEIDTVNKTLSSYYNDKLISSKTDCPIAVGKPVDTIRFFGLSRTDEGSYVKIKNFKITQKERATNTTLSSLPEKLVNDVERVTETSVTLPVIEGVTWASADLSAATINGNTLNFNIPETGTKEAVVTATFAQDGYEYTKTYKMTMEKGVVYEFSYTVSDGKVTITALPSDFAGSVVIPDTIDGYPVTSIGNSAFDGCTGLTEVTIPNSVTTIGDYAFYNCTGLAEVTIPDSVTSIGDSAFEGCSNLKTAWYPGSKEQWDKVSNGSYNSALTNVIVYKRGTCGGNLEWAYSDGVLTISGSGGMADWSSSSSVPWYNVRNMLTKVMISEGVTGIGEDAFRDCTSLKEITIPNSVTSIGRYAFRGCTGLTEITIPDSVTRIGNQAFYNTAYFNNSENWENDVLYIGNHLIDAKISLSGTYDIKGGTLTIGDYAFYNCEGLTEITIPNSVTRIGNQAFEYCSNLKAAWYPGRFEQWFYKVSVGSYNSALTDAVIYMGEPCGENLTWNFSEGVLTISGSGDITKSPWTNAMELITKVIIEDGVTSIGEYAFRGCTGLTEVTIGNSVKSIGDDAFYECTGLTEITIPDRVTSIGYSAFSGCTSLTEATIGNSVKSIEMWTFANCTSLTEVTIGNSVKSIGDNAFYECTGLTKVNITDLKAWCGITFGDYSANPFGYAENLYVNNTLVTKLVIPDGVTSIGSHAFAHCTGLTEVTIPNSVTSIGNSSFHGCTGLTEVTIPNSVTSIGNYAFGGCTGLTEVTIPNSVKSIGSHAFSNCTGLTEVTIPDSVTSIGSSAFSNCTGLTEVTIGNGVTSIGDDAFIGCRGLTEITIPNSVKSIGSSAFYYCSLKAAWYYGSKEQWNNVWVSSHNGALTDAVVYMGEPCGKNLTWDLSDGVLTISGSGDMTNWTSSSRAPWYNARNMITKVVISEGVTSIGSSAFYERTGLTEVTIPNSVTSIGSDTFYKCTGLTKVNISDLKAWCGITFEDLDANPLYYAGNLYVNNTLVTKLVIPDGITSIGSYAFSGCTGLTEITIPNSVTSIGNYAFRGCTGLTEVTIPDSVTTIGSSAFNGCTGLTEITIPDSVTSIGDYAFRGCTGLRDVTIPNSVTSIGSYAFYDCVNLRRAWYHGSKEQWDNVSVGSYNSALTNVIVYKAEPCGENLEWAYSDGVLTISGSGDMTNWSSASSVPWYGARNMLTKVIISEGVTSIGQSAFRGCTGLTEITIPDSVTSIGDYTFYGCTGLTEVTIPEGVTSIGQSAFYNCSNLKAAWYHGSKEQWNNVSVGSNNSALTNCVLCMGEPCGENLEWAYSDGVLTISGSGKMNDWSSSSRVPWYKGCESITKLIIEDGVTSIGHRAFYGCTSLTEITIPDSVTSIGSYAFYGCTGLTEITIPDGVTSIGEGAFYNTAHYNNSEIWENGVLYIRKHLIKANEEVAGAYNIKEGTLTIADYAFAGCTSLTELTIPNSVTSIGSSAFYGCTGLVKTNISDLKAWCGIIFADNPIYYSKNLYLNNELITELVLPDTITTINNSAFANCKSLTKVVIPDSVTHIGRYVFYNCTGLEEITLPFVGTESATDKVYEAVLGVIFGGEDDCYTANQQITSQEIQSFKIPNSLKKVTITNQKVIPYGAFSGFIGLEEIVLSENVEEVSTNAFLNCDNLELAVFNNKDTKIARTNFVGCDIAKISGYTDSTAEKFANAYLFEFVPLSEQTNEFEILCKNLVQGTSDITMDICVTSPTEPEGKIYVALYDEEHMLQVKVYDAKEIVNAKLDFAEGEYIKIMWWDSEYKPIIENLKIDL